MQTKIIAFPIGEKNIITLAIEEVNEDYETNFRLIDVENRDGVTFAIIDIGQNNSEMIFTLGYFYGMKCENQRMQDSEYAQLSKSKTKLG